MAFPLNLLSATEYAGKIMTQANQISTWMMC